MLKVKCQIIFHLISKNVQNVELISDNISRYNGGVTIIPVHLSKGLEFDLVIIADYDTYNDTILERQLLYVACTRTMHTLDILKRK